MRKSKTNIGKKGMTQFAILLIVILIILFLIATINNQSIFEVIGLNLTTPL